MSRRADQVASTMRRAVQSVLSEGLADPRIEGMITVTDASVTDDLTECVVSVSVLPEDKEKLVLHGLNDAANYVRREAAERVSMHRPPRLIFKLDRSAKRQRAVLDALAQIRDQQPPGSADADAPPVAPDDSENPR